MSDCMCCRVLATSLRSATPEAVFIVGLTAGFQVGREPGAFEPVTLCPRHEDMFTRAAGSAAGAVPMTPAGNGASGIAVGGVVRVDAEGRRRSGTSGTVRFVGSTHARVEFDDELAEWFELAHLAPIQGSKELQP